MVRERFGVLCKTEFKLVSSKMIILLMARLSILMAILYLEKSSMNLRNSVKVNNLTQLDFVLTALTLKEGMSSYVSSFMANSV